MPLYSIPLLEYDGNKLILIYSSIPCIFFFQKSVFHVKLNRFRTMLINVLPLFTNPFLMLLEQSKPSGQGFDSHGLIIRDFGELKPSVTLGIELPLQSGQTAALLRQQLDRERTTAQVLLQLMLLRLKLLNLRR